MRRGDAIKKKRGEGRSAVAVLMLLRACESSLGPTGSAASNAYRSASASTVLTRARAPFCRVVVRERAGGAERRAPFVGGPRRGLRHNMIALLMSIAGNQPQQPRNRTPRPLGEPWTPHRSTTPSRRRGWRPPRAVVGPRRGRDGAAPSQLTFFSRSQPLASGHPGPPGCLR